MNPNITLRQLMTLAMEGAERNFRLHGSVVPVLLVVTAGGELSINALPMRDELEHRAAPHVARAILEEHGARLYVYGAEAWVTDLKLPEGATAGDIAAAAFKPRAVGKKEAIPILGATREGERLQGGYDIIRSAAGQGTLVRRAIRPSDDTLGDWANLFEPAARPEDLEPAIARVLERVRRATP